MNPREEDREMKRQPGQPLPGERGRETGGKPELEPEHAGKGQSPVKSPGNLPSSGKSGVE